MLKWLNKLIGAGDIGSEADPTENADIKTVVPLIIPRECAVPEWPGPVVVLGDLPFAVSWAAIPSPNRFNYVTHDQATLWKSNDIDWRNVAMRNLEEITAAKRWSGYKDDSSGKPFVVVMLHDDAFGPSRLLLPHLLDDVLGSDYHVAIPERTCAVAYRRSLTADEKADVDGMIEGCFQHGTEPMSDQRFSPQDFWTLPEATVSQTSSTAIAVASPPPMQACPCEGRGPDPDWSFSASPVMLSAMKTGYVYIMASGQNGTLYVGVTSDLAKRGWEHRNGLVRGFTKKYGCKLLVWYEVHADLQEARLRELQIKKWKRIWKLSEIEQMNPDWRDLYPTLLEGS